jgi:hypothetical protein
MNGDEKLDADETPISADERGYCKERKRSFEKIVQRPFLLRPSASIRVHLRPALSSAFICVLLFPSAFILPYLVLSWLPESTEHRVTSSGEHLARARYIATARCRSCMVSE